MSFGTNGTNGATPQAGRKLNLTGQQMTALILAEYNIGMLGNAGLVAHQLGGALLAEAYKEAILLLQKAHDQYVEDTQRAVKIASPGDLTKLPTAH